MLTRLSGLLAAVAVVALLSPAAPATAAPARAPLPQTIQAWGSNSYGELGNGTTTDSSTPGPVKIPANTRFTSARCLLSCLAVTTTGQLYAWGNNTAGQLGDGTTKQRLTPVRVHLPAGTKVTAVRPGAFFTLALTASGKVLAWGTNQVGQLGIGATTERHRPVFVSFPTGVKATALAAGKDYSIALTSQAAAPGPRAGDSTPVMHALLVWGGGEAGQLGTGTTAGSLVPVHPKLSDLLQPSSIGSGWGSVTSVAVCTQTPV